MNRAALAAALVFAGGGLFWASRRAVAAALPSSPAGTAVALAPIDLNVLIEDAMSNITGTWTPPERAAPYLEDIKRAEDRYGIPRNLLARLLYQESRYREDIITGALRSSAGAQGIAQFMPATAAELGVDPLNPSSAIDGAGKYLRRLYDALGTWEMALAAYNWGIGNVQRKGFAAAPEETRRYVAEITGDVGVA